MQTDNPFSPAIRDFNRRLVMEVLANMRGIAAVWRDPIMAAHLDGAKHFAMRMLIDLAGDCNATQAEQLVDEAIRQAKGGDHAN